METTQAQPKKGSHTGVIVVMLFVAILLIFGGESSNLTCRHSRQPATVSCVKQSVLLWVLPLSTKIIENVSGAQLSESSGYDDGAVYRVELLTSQGIFPLTAMYTSGFSTKSDVVDQVNAYVKSTRQGNLVVSEPGLLSLENLFCMIIWLPIAWALNTLFGGYASLLGIGKK